MSNPSCPGGVKREQESKSVMAIEIALCSLAWLVRAVSEEDEGMFPSLPGVDTTTAKYSDASHVVMSPR
jgi:hypothetical protein